MLIELAGMWCAAEVMLYSIFCVLEWVIALAAEQQTPPPTVP
jgi:hypothetical protein